MSLTDNRESQREDTVYLCRVGVLPAADAVPWDPCLEAKTDVAAQK